MVSVNIGCGSERLRSGDYKVDLRHSVLTLEDSVQADVTQGLPLRTGYFDEVYTSHFLEHLTNEQHPQLFSEFWRILKPGGKLVIHVPYAMSHAGFQDPTHVSFWVPERFLYFTPHFSMLEYPWEHRFQLLTCGIENEDEVQAVMIKTLDGDNCNCPIHRAIAEGEDFHVRA